MYGHSPRTNMESSLLTCCWSRWWNLDSSPNHSKLCSVLYLSSQYSTSLYLELELGRYSILVGKKDDELSSNLTFPHKLGHSHQGCDKMPLQSICVDWCRIWTFTIYKLVKQAKNCTHKAHAWLLLERLCHYLGCLLTFDETCAEASVFSCLVWHDVSVNNWSDVKVYIQLKDPNTITCFMLKCFRVLSPVSYKKTL